MGLASAIIAVGGFLLRELATGALRVLGRRVFSRPGSPCAAPT